MYLKPKSITNAAGQTAPGSRATAWHVGGGEIAVRTMPGDGGAAGASPRCVPPRRWSLLGRALLRPGPALWGLRVGSYFYFYFSVFGLFISHFFNILPPIFLVVSSIYFNFYFLGFVTRDVKLVARVARPRSTEDR